MNVTGGYIRFIKDNDEYNEKFFFDGATDTRWIKFTAAVKKLKHGSRITITADADATLSVKELFLDTEIDIEPGARIFCNGYQSWTDSREFCVSEKIKPLNILAKIVKLNYFGDYNFTPYPGRAGEFHSYTYSYLRMQHGAISFAGSIDESSGYTIFEFNAGKNSLKISKECGGMIIRGRIVIFDLYISREGDSRGISEYFTLLNPQKKSARFSTGWTSWYNHYTDISSTVIRENLKSFSDAALPIDTFQIDDGWQANVGDWLHVKPSFPEGMEKISSEIKRHGYKSGLWLAPFICEKSSAIYKNHHEWLLKDENGKPVPGGWNPSWSGNFYALDIYNPSFVNYLKEVFDTVLKKWGFDMVKLDFLYAAAQLPRAGRPRGAVMRDAMILLRRLCGKKIILGCGVPLGSAFGLVDYCRIGSDVALRWEDQLLKKINYRERVSTINSLTSTIGRRDLNGNVFVSDPDVFILRDENCFMSPAQKHTLFMLNNIFGGLLFTSDNPSEYSHETLELYKSMFPFKKKQIISVDFDSGIYKIIFSIGHNLYTVYSNVSEGSRADILDKGLFFVNTQYGEPEFITGPSRIILKPHESRCYYRVPESGRCFAGSTSHLFPGSETEEIFFSGKKIKVKFDKYFRGCGKIFVRVPREGDYTINGVKTTARMVSPGLIISSAELNNK